MPISEKTEIYRKVNNLCMKCGKASPRENKTICQECFEKHQKYTSKTYHTKKNNDICTRCGLKTGNGILCETCKIYVKKERKIYRDRHNINNLCVVCGKIKDTVDGVSCSSCRTISNNNAKLYRRKQTKLIFDHYGGKCKNCGEEDNDVLCIDHINGGGTKHVEQLKKNGTLFYPWIIKNNFPPDLQLLCHNCNIKKYKQILKQKSTEEIGIISVGIPSQG